MKAAAAKPTLKVRLRAMLRTALRSSLLKSAAGAKLLSAHASGAAPSVATKPATLKPLIAFAVAQPLPLSAAASASGLTLRAVLIATPVATLWATALPAALGYEVLLAMRLAPALNANTHLSAPALIISRTRSRAIKALARSPVIVLNLDDILTLLWLCARGGGQKPGESDKNGGKTLHVRCPFYSEETGRSSSGKSASDERLNTPDWCGGSLEPAWR